MSLSVGNDYPVAVEVIPCDPACHFRPHDNGVKCDRQLTDVPSRPPSRVRLSEHSSPLADLARSADRPPAEQDSPPSSPLAVAAAYLMRPLPEPWHPPDGIFRRPSFLPPPPATGNGYPMPPEVAGPESGGVCPPAIPLPIPQPVPQPVPSVPALPRVAETSRIHTAPPATSATARLPPEYALAAARVDMAAAAFERIQMRRTAALAAYAERSALYSARRRGAVERTSVVAGAAHKRVMRAVQDARDLALRPVVRSAPAPALPSAPATLSSTHAPD
eukprot:TRINITY_DN6906_c1_g1_i1.p1 TRINITY_DN6906_c1_g1~~TRINITY_DN6906_c1_g1_i1.p1  ORF type:complete len:276 (-),score=6.89 TRINITY_DN6906_c1_g1_i1:118-945(-)